MNEQNERRLSPLNPGQQVIQPIGRSVVSVGQIPEDLIAYAGQKRDWRSLGYDKGMHLPRPPKVEALNALQSADIVDALLEKGALRSDKIGEVSDENIKVAVSKLINISDVLQSSVVTIADGVTSILTTTLTDEKNISRILFATCEVQAYQTSVAANNQIPEGSAVTDNDYRLHSALSLNSDERNAVFKMTVTNNSGSDKDVLYQVRWRWVGLPIGVAS